MKSNELSRGVVSCELKLLPKVMLLFRGKGWSRPRPETGCCVPVCGDGDGVRLRLSGREADGDLRRFWASMVIYIQYHD